MTPEERAFRTIGDLAPLTRRDEWWTSDPNMPLDIIAKAIAAARLESLEEAAKIAETLQAKTFEIPGGGLYARPPAAEDIAAAIRERAKAE